MRHIVVEKYLKLEEQPSEDQGERQEGVLIDLLVDINHLIEVEIGEIAG
jgi:hypothetical protein